MATLFERLYGKSDLDETLPEERKIFIHLFVGVFLEVHRGRMTPAEVTAEWDLDAAQQSQAAALNAKIDAAPNKELFIRVLKNWLYFAESTEQPDAKWHDQSNFLSTLDAEITAQGGTPP